MTALALDPAGFHPLSEEELDHTHGGAWPAIGIAVGAYMGLLSKIESNPEAYTWTMDWYYN